MKKTNYMSWHTYFMSIAVLSSLRSKDPKTQNGACIVGKENKIIGMGYNGLPRGCSDDDSQYWEDDDHDILNSKHTYVVHAEKNAIYNAMAHDISHAKMYITQFPCNTCAQAIIQVGIKEIVFLRKKKHSHHSSLNQAVNKMFNDSGVTIFCYKDLDIDDKFYLEALEKTEGLYY